MESRQIDMPMVHVKDTYHWQIVIIPLEFQDEKVGFNDVNHCYVG